MADYFVVLDHFPSKFVDFVVKLLICLKFFAYCGFPNNFIDVTAELVLNCDGLCSTQAFSQAPHCI